ncbi:hypothetical protein [Liquorilactobacillus nagelii]|jgi:hypothetical protein|uniref:hypothetical protein n=1 Tax=Liquorilactobacillus nagelii TaxID=82688 RepID=UPI00242C6266|nr:hypothetical protein [Liquorilactobacillus nagelii]MCI1699484.1 hypothetical protein [Liquorilactobacillus nagelii]
MEVIKFIVKKISSLMVIYLIAYLTIIEGIFKKKDIKDAIFNLIKKSLIQKQV